MEKKIGEIFYFNNKKIKVVNAEGPCSCKDCIFVSGKYCIRGEAVNFVGLCFYTHRSDQTSVKFVEIKESEFNMDKKKELTISIPDGYEIDEDLSSFDKIIFKKKRQIKTWSDLIGEKMPKGSVYISGTSQIKEENVDLLFWKDSEKNIFIDKRYAKSSLAMSQISQLLPYYGGAITEEEWEDDSFFKYNIERYKNTVYLDGHSTMYTFLAFHTEEQRDSFYENNKQLVNDYLMISNND